MRRLALLWFPLLVLGLAGTGCGDGRGGPPPAPVADTGPSSAPQAELAARAAAAKDLVGTDSYTLTRAGSDAGITVKVVRAADGSWRVDIPGGALGGTVDVAFVHTGGTLFQCALPAAPRPEAQCVPVERLTPEIDPRIQHVFVEWLDVFTTQAAPVAVSSAAPVTALPAEAAGACYAVEPSTASLAAPVDPGVYCYTTDGRLTGAALSFGTLIHTGTGDEAPASVGLPGPVADHAEPLPTASPSPRPSPTAGPEPTGSVPPAPSRTRRPQREL